MLPGARSHTQAQSAWPGSGSPATGRRSKKSEARTIGPGCGFSIHEAKYSRHTRSGWRQRGFEAMKSPGQAGKPSRTSAAPIRFARSAK